jgi:hypothetical protein
LVERGRNYWRERTRLPRHSGLHLIGAKIHADSHSCHSLASRLRLARHRGSASRTVETGGHPDPANAVGDKGKAIGPYQIHRAYWQDAVEYDPSIGGTYADCKDHRYARRIVIAYLSRYCKKWDYETPARIHNGGPKGHTKTATVKYWNKVKNNL